MLMHSFFESGGGSPWDGSEGVQPTVCLCYVQAPVVSALASCAPAFYSSSCTLASAFSVHPEIGT